MAGISTAIQVTDRISGTLNRITSSLYATTDAFGDVDKASDTTFNSMGAQVMANEMYGYSQRVRQLESDLVDANVRLLEMEEQTKKVTNAGDSLAKAMRFVKSAITGMAIKGIVDMSDKIVQTTARLSAMNDGVLTTEELIESVYIASQNARGSFLDMANVVAKLGNNAGKAFNNNTEEIVRFATLVQQQMTIAGASTIESSNAMLQLTQALGSGVLRGDELNSIFEQAPNIIHTIADYLDVDIGKIREMATEGMITADIVKNAIFSAQEEIEQKFSQMPMTWGQVWQSMENTAIMKFQPILNKINELANSGALQQFIGYFTWGLTNIANAILIVIDFAVQLGNFISQNWSVIGPVVGTIITVLGVYLAVMGAIKLAELIGIGVKVASMVASYALAWATGTVASSTAIATATQYGFNTALLSSPITWIIVIIIALISAIIIFATKVAETSDLVGSAFGVICGWVNVGLQFFKNLGLGVANVAIGIYEALKACGENMGIAFGNAIKGIQSWFNDLLATALYTVAGIAQALNKLPFVDIDYSGVVDKANEYALKAQGYADSKKEYVSVGDAFSKGASTFSAFENGWVNDAFSKGASFGDNISNKVSEALDKLKMKEEFDKAYTDTGDGSLIDYNAEIADNTNDMSKSIDISNENLKYLRDIAEREAINRFTTAEIKVDMTNNNNINNTNDIDGIIEKFTQGVQEALLISAEGVHS